MKKAKNIRTRNKPVPKTQFKIFFAPRTSAHYVDVNIHANRKNMLAWREKKSECEAFFSGDREWSQTIKFDDTGKEKTYGNPRIGMLHFYPGSLRMGVIAHELYHAVTCYARLMACLPDVHEHCDAEEICAELMGSLMAQMIVALAEKHCLKKTSIQLEKDYYE